MVREIALLCAVLISATVRASAGSPYLTISDGGVLKRAAGNISFMSEKEAIALAEVLARCTDTFSKDLVVLHDCDATYRLYRIQFAHGRDVDDLLSAIDLLGSSFRIKNDANKPATDEDFNAMQREIDVRRVLEDAVNERLRLLRKE